MKISFDCIVKTHSVCDIACGELFVLANQQNSTFAPDVFMKIERNGHTEFLNMETGKVRSGNFNPNTPVIKCESELKVSKCF